MPSFAIRPPKEAPMTSQTPHPAKDTKAKTPPPARPSPLMWRALPFTFTDWAAI